MNTNVLAPALLVSLLFVARADAKSADELTRAGTPEQKGQNIALELAARNTGYKDLGGEIEMTLRDAGGGEAKRRFTLKLLERPSPDSGDWSLIVFDSPADVKNTAVLSHGRVGQDDEQWLYLPSVNRVKRIAAASRAGAFAGSEFSFEDLTASDGRKYTWKLAGTEPCGTLSCFVVEATPKDPSSSYSRRVLRIDTTELRVASVEFFDRRGGLMKTLTYGDYKKVGDRFWRAQTWTMTNHQSKKSTVLSFTSMRINNGYTVSDFAPGKLGN